MPNCSISNSHSLASCRPFYSVIFMHQVHVHRCDSLVSGLPLPVLTVLFLSCSFVTASNGISYSLPRQTRDTPQGQIHQPARKALATHAHVHAVTQTHMHTVVSHSHVSLSIHAWCKECLASNAWMNVWSKGSRAGIRWKGDLWLRKGFKSNKAQISLHPTLKQTSG